MGQKKLDLILILNKCPIEAVKDDKFANGYFMVEVLIYKKQREKIVLANHRHFFAKGLFFVDLQVAFFSRLSSQQYFSLQ